MKREELLQGKQCAATAKAPANLGIKFSRQNNRIEIKIRVKTNGLQENTYRSTETRGKRKPFSDIWMLTEHGKVALDSTGKHEDENMTCPALRQEEMKICSSCGFDVNNKANRRNRIAVSWKISDFYFGLDLRKVAISNIPIN
ncbi:hypothetical protein BTVI_21511 [Pitangus sulphuratus]|nr:hypothetical protein BTVI_21511 [Pitangus sulphuratus]